MPGPARGRCMIKNRFKDDYSRFLRLNGKGRVVDDICYTGDYYILPFNKEEKRKTNLANTGFTAVLMAIQIVAGIVNQDSSRTFWIVYPYLFIFLPLGYLLLGVVSYFGDPLRMQKAQYETGIARIRRSLCGASVLAAGSGLLTMVYMVLHRGDIHLGKELLYLLCHCLFLTAAFLYGRYYNRTYSGITVEKASR